MHTRKLAMVGAAALLIGLAASPPAQAGFTMNGISMNGISMNGLRLNGLKFNGLKINGLRMNGSDQPVGFNFNALKLHAVVLPTGAQ
jgi:hypothetical protein